jgi:hypothetical protein
MKEYITTSQTHHIEINLVCSKTGGELQAQKSTKSSEKAARGKYMALEPWQCLKTN